MPAPTPSTYREEAARQVTDAMVEAAAEALRTALVYGEQQSWKDAARAALTAALAVDEQSWRRW
jgi:hypothetical protein